MNVVEKNTKKAPVAWLPNTRPMAIKGLTSNRRGKKPESPTYYSSILQAVAGTFRQLLSIYSHTFFPLFLPRAKSKEIYPRSTRRSAKPAAPPAPSLALRSYLPVLACQSPCSAVCRLFSVSPERTCRPVRTGGLFSVRGQGEASLHNYEGRPPLLR